MSSTVAIDRDGQGVRVAVAGDLRIALLPELERGLAAVTGPGPIVVDGSGVEEFDTAGAWALVSLRRRLQAEGVEVRIDGLTPPQAALLATVEKSLPEGEERPPPPRRLSDWVASIGERAVRALQGGLGLLGLLGAVVSRIGGMILHPRRLRLTSVVYHMQAAGLDAVPIVSLMAFLIGIVLTFQGAAQLRQFGAEIFVVDLIAISVLRELGILLTAIIVAGRSASAFTAAIGSMKMQEEIDAMRTLGLDPIEVLVVPRFIALVITLPLLGFIADLMGLVGGAAMSWVQLGISPDMFRVRLVEGTDVWHFLVGIIKAPFFAAIIALIGCDQGLKVEENADSLGRLTSKSVVLAIFMVILADALFSIFFEIVGV